MSPEQKQFLSLLRLPARLNPEQVGWKLGFEAHHIPVLVAAGMLKPLGNPPRNGQKYFAAAVIKERGDDERWIARASDAVTRHSRDKNARKRRPDEPGNWPPIVTPKDAA
jgi:hypothetical protein